MDTIQRYERIIKAQQSVLFLKGEPGCGKTAIPEYIAKKNGWNYVDLRLAQRDSSEVIGIPLVYAKLKDGREVPEKMIGYLGISLDDIETFYTQYIPPKWAINANLSKIPTLVSAEELNRAPLEVRNAFLQIMLEHRVGEDFQLNDNIHFVATGNLGEDDDCEVEELDRALLGRLYVVRHNLPIQDWVKYFAKDNVNPIIVNFVKAYPEYAYKVFQADGGKDSKDTATMDAYCCYRSLTFLSNFVGKTEKDYGKIIADVEEFGKGFIGLAYRKLIQFIKETQRITIQDVLDRYDEVKELIKQRPRDINNELLTNLEKVNYSKVKVAQYKNIVKFISSLDPDLRMGYLNFVFNNKALISIEFKEDKTSKDTSIEDIENNSEIVYKNKTIEKFFDMINEVFNDELSKLSEENVIL